MKGKIRLDGRSKSLTAKGFPIVFSLAQDNKQKLIVTGFHAKSKHWDSKNALPTSKHPDYINLLNYLSVAKIKLAQLVNKSRTHYISLERAKHLLLKNDSTIFYKLGVDYINNHDLKRTYIIALTAFNKMYSDYDCKDISPNIVTSFKNRLLKTPVNGKPRSPNGVASYLATLTALWNKLNIEQDNPFSKVKVKSVRTKSKALSIMDLNKIKGYDIKPHFHSGQGGVFNFCKYFMLCFYLGGIDFVDIANLKTTNIVAGRIEFVRFKGGSDIFISNKIFPEAQEIMDYYQNNNSKKLVPLTPEFLTGWHGNLSRNREGFRKSMGMEKKAYTKSARYTFINFSRALLLDRRVIEEIVGHSSGGTHSVYEENYPTWVRDEAHRKVIDLVIGN